MTPNDSPRASVAVVTINRPHPVRRCLTHLLAQDPPPHEVVVVDASADTRTTQVVAEFPSIIYLRNDRGLGHTTLSRNMAAAQTTGEVLAFVDDDAYARPGWLAALVAPFADPTVGGVAGRALNGQPGEDREGQDQVGRVTRNGDVLGHFAADTGRLIDVDHAIGCNMAIRRSVLAECGGFRYGFDGAFCFREETDVFFVMKRLGYRVVFTPFAIVDHVAGPKPKGRRFDPRGEYFGVRNHLILLLRNYGPASAIVWRALAAYAVRSGSGFVKTITMASIRVSLGLCGVVVGVIRGIAFWVVERPGRRPGRVPSARADSPTTPAAV